MAELEHELRALAPAIDWPPTPALEPRPEPRPARARLRPLWVALALLLIALAVALSVPAARSAILRVFHLGGVTVERVTTLPPARERPLQADLGVRVDARTARETLGAPMRLPKLDHPPQLYQRGTAVSALLARAEPVLLTEFRADSAIFKKIFAGRTTAVPVRVGTAPGLWIAGDRHVFVPFEAEPRLAGNVLIWQVGAITFRLEGRHLSKHDALALAAEIDGT